MEWNVTPCSTWQLYVIIDRAAIGHHDPTDVATGAIRGGADVIQLRDKSGSARRLMEDARCLLPLTRAAKIPLILNDRADVVRAVGADGVHLGQDDLPIEDARAMLDRGKLLGISTHSLEQALRAEREGADYIGLGPIFQTPTKPTYSSVGLELIRHVATRVRIPIVCIGGINLTNLAQVVQADAQCIAVVRAICSAPDPEAATRSLKTKLQQFLRTAASS